MLDTPWSIRQGVHDRSDSLDEGTRQEEHDYCECVDLTTSVASVVLPKRIGTPIMDSP